MTAGTHRSDTAGLIGATSSSRPVWPGTATILPALLEWASSRRWFPLKSGPLPHPEDVRIVADVELAPSVHDLVLALPAPSSAGHLLLHVPLVLDVPEALPRLTGPSEADCAAGFSLTLPSSEGHVQANAGPQVNLAVVDGPHHPAFWQTWARLATEAGTYVDAQAAEAIIQRAGRLRVTTGEQSNTSVILPAPEPGSEAQAADAATEDLIVKIFRVLAAGRNPDVEISVGLARDGWDRVKRPVAWSTLNFTDPDTGEQAEADAAVATTFIPKASDGFELFCRLAGGAADQSSSTHSRALGLANELGQTTAQMHQHLAAAFGSSEPATSQELAQSLRQRAQWALTEVPELMHRLPGLEEGLRMVLDDLARLDHLEPATRIHGDYHLGQTLHEDEGAGRWFVLDFEGEPLRPLADRRRPDQAARDVAGMLRSFDYAAAIGKATDSAWAVDMRAAFMDGYRQFRPVHGEDAHRAQVLLDALELDKALYEAVYEARNRPAWLWIPVAGIARVLGTDPLAS